MRLRRPTREPGLDISRERRAPIPFIGFSDNTTLHAAHAALGVISFHAPHPGADFPPELAGKYLSASQWLPAYDLTRSGKSMTPRLALPSAGVMLLAANLLPSGQLDGQWTIAEQPSVVIGAVAGDPNNELNRVMGAVRLSSGGLAILNDWQLRLYEASGSHVRTVGRQGNGPGEFQGPQLYRRPGDTLVVLDVPLSRITTFDAEGNLVSVARFDPPEPLAGYSIESSRVRLLSDGTILYSMAELIPPPYRRRFARYHPQQRRWTLLGSPIEVGGQVFRYGSQTIAMDRPFCCWPWVAAGPDRIYITAGDQFVIDVYAFDGTRIDRFSLTHRQAEPVTKEDEARYYRTYIEPDKERNPARAPLLDRAWSALDKGSHHMAIRDMFVDDLGYLWLEASVLGREEKLWLVLDRQGREVAAIRPPQGLEWISSAGQDYVRGGRRGDFDVPHVVIHQLVRSPER